MCYVILHRKLQPFDILSAYICIIVIFLFLFSISIFFSFSLLLLLINHDIEQA